MREYSHLTQLGYRRLHTQVNLTLENIRNCAEALISAWTCALFNSTWTIQIKLNYEKFISQFFISQFNKCHLKNFNLPFEYFEHFQICHLNIFELTVSISNSSKFNIFQNMRIENDHSNRKAECDIRHLVEIRMLLCMCLCVSRVGRGCVYVYIYSVAPHTTQAEVSACISRSEWTGLYTRTDHTAHLCLAF